MRRPIAPGLLAALVLLAPGARAAEDVVSATLAGAEGQAVVEVTVAPGWHVNAHDPRDDFLVPTTLTLLPPDGMRAGEVVYPEPVERRLAFGGDHALRLYTGRVRFTARLEGTPAAGAGPLRAALRYQACNDSRCLPPRTLELVARGERLSAPAGALSAGPVETRVRDWIEGSGYALTFLWVALLGLALNLTPCVYPLISVTVAFFGGTTGATGRPVVRALAYVLGICLTFSGLGVAAALTGSMFGAALQRPAVLAAIALVLIVLAASNLGLYTFRVPAPLMRRVGRVGDGVLGAFFMGLTMGIVAAPCIGPIVVALLLFVGARQSAALGFALFFTLALGMGAPYVGLAAAAGRLRRLPRSGPWLEWVERAFAFLLLGLAVYFLAPLLRPGTVRAAYAFLGVAAGIVLGFLTPGGRRTARWSRQLAGLVLVAVSLGWLISADAGSPITWVPFSEEALARATAARRPVLIDVGADWCLPCREMERTTFRDPAVVRTANAFATLKIDATAGDERVQTILQRFNVPGVPTYLLLDASGRERRRFIGAVAAQDLLGAMRELVPAAEARGG
ncbi:MAG: DUF255 domain-containing protein [Deltaproteobacteria bacterium]|nr:MAG: DUF255 domain-containing protein [Deltaproteobacteria bacterium]